MSSSDQSPSHIQPQWTGCPLLLLTPISGADSAQRHDCSSGVETLWLVHDGRESRKAEKGVSSMDEAAASHDFTARVCFPCSFIEGFGLVTQVF